MRASFESETKMSAVLFALMICFQGAHALEPIKFGPEFTFMPDNAFIVESPERRFHDHLIVDQPDGAKFRFMRDGIQSERYTSPNGWWFNFYTDSGGYEVGMSPMTVGAYKKFAVDIQDAVFVTMANSGYFPALWQGGGHINVDLVPFRRNPMLFRNFVVDLFSHNELP